MTPFSTANLELAMIARILLQCLSYYAFKFSSCYGANQGFNRQKKCAIYVQFRWSTAWGSSQHSSQHSSVTLGYLFSPLSLGFLCGHAF
jgi:hypothetical protein